MAEHPNASDPSSPERNPLGLGPRDPESSNTGSTDDTSYNARGSDPYQSGEPVKRADAAPDGAHLPADPAPRSADES